MAASQLGQRGKWVKASALGKPGKEGRVYLVHSTDDMRTTFAMKEFKSRKSVNKVQKEAACQQRAAEAGVAPSVVEVIEQSPPAIVMGCMERTVIDVCLQQEGVLTDTQQRRILRCYQQLDGIGLLHNDANALNLMARGRGEKEEWRLIDYGYARDAKGGEDNIRLGLDLLLHDPRLGLVTTTDLREPPRVLLDALDAYESTGRGKLLCWRRSRVMGESTVPSVAVEKAPTSMSYRELQKELGRLGYSGSRNAKRPELEQQYAAMLAAHPTNTAAAAAAAEGSTLTRTLLHVIVTLLAVLLALRIGTETESVPSPPAGRAAEDVPLPLSTGASVGGVHVPDVIAGASVGMGMGAGAGAGRST